MKRAPSQAAARERRKLEGQASKYDTCECGAPKRKHAKQCLECSRGITKLRAATARWRGTDTCECGAPKDYKAQRCWDCYSRSRQRTECAVDGCERVAKTKGLCNTHYERLRTLGSVLADVPIGEKRPTYGPPAPRKRPEREKGWAWRLEIDEPEPKPRAKRAPKRDTCVCGGTKLITSAACLDCFRANRQPEPQPRRVLVPRDVPINSWADARSLGRHVPMWEAGAARSSGRSSEATRYVGDTGLTKETIRNAVYCPACGAGPTYRCLYESPLGPHTRERSKFHDERIAAAVIKLAPMLGTRNREVTESLHPEGMEHKETNDTSTLH